MARAIKSPDFSDNPTSAAWKKAFGPWPTSELGSQALSYWIDSWQRSLLVWDVMRERGNIIHST
jgi:hypothetical protein